MNLVETINGHLVDRDYYQSIKEYVDTLYSSHGDGWEEKLDGLCEEVCENADCPHFYREED